MHQELWSLISASAASYDSTGGLSRTVHSLFIPALKPCWVFNVLGIQLLSESIAFLEECFNSHLNFTAPAGRGGHANWFGSSTIAGGWILRWFSAQTGLCSISLTSLPSNCSSLGDKRWSIQLSSTACWCCVVELRDEESQSSWEAGEL